MNYTTLSSTFLLTLLLSVGLVFFIRASAKDRTREIKLLSEQPEDSLMAQLQQYFQARSYKILMVEPETKSVTFEGFVQPSIFLATFLTLLAAAGILCLVLVWSLLFPGLSQAFLSLVLLAPAAGVFYWKKAARTEQVSLRLENTTGEQPKTTSQVTVIAHRDELIALQRSLKLKMSE